MEQFKQPGESGSTGTLRCHRICIVYRAPDWGIFFYNLERDSPLSRRNSFRSGQFFYFLGHILSLDYCLFTQSSSLIPLFFVHILSSSIFPPSGVVVKRPFCSYLTRGRPHCIPLMSIYQKPPRERRAEMEKSLRDGEKAFEFHKKETITGVSESGFLLYFAVLMP